MSENKILLPHHEQQTLCTSRLPYRQGRKLTAVKVYTVTTESNHLLIFGVPSLNLRQETKTLFIKFGKLLQFTISPDHASEPFTETYHAQYERIQSARVAKKMLDTKNFYGGSLHVCYAPEFETIEETKQKLIQRQKDVINRLRNLQKEKYEVKEEPKPNDKVDKEIIKNINNKKLNMGDINTFNVNNEKVVRKKKKHPKDDHKLDFKTKIAKKDESKETLPIHIQENAISDNIEVVDFTSVEEEVLTNINESLNYNKFGNEVIKKIKDKPLNKITFNINKKV